MADREVPEACRDDYYAGAVLALTAAENVPGTAGVNTTVILYNALRDARRAYYHAAPSAAASPAERLGWQALGATEALDAVLEAHEGLPALSPRTVDGIRALRDVYAAWQPACLHARPPGPPRGHSRRHLPHGQVDWKDSRNEIV